MPRLSQRTIIALLVLLCIATRIPQLVSDKLLLDGDEAVVAILAKHIFTAKTSLFTSMASNMASPLSNVSSFCRFTRSWESQQWL